MKEKSTSSKYIHYFVSVCPDNYGGLNVYNSSVIYKLEIVQPSQVNVQYVRKNVQVLFVEVRTITLCEDVEDVEWKVVCF